MYAIYCPECEELWQETFTDVSAAAKALQEWIMINEELSDFERYQIVEFKPAAKIEAVFKIELKYLD